jgi:exodeoxyribonuclease VII small subunit
MGFSLSKFETLILTDIGTATTIEPFQGVQSMTKSNLKPGNPGVESFNPIEELTYEQAFTELEAIVAALETNERVLAEAMALYQRGQELAKFCAQQLDQAELKVQKIAGDELVSADF